VFQVDRDWAGVSAHRLSLFMDEGDCTFAFAAGRHYVVFAHRDPHGRPTTSVCSRTSESDHAQEVLKALGPPRRDRRARG
jgi:hypothetical protein